VSSNSHNANVTLHFLPAAGGVSSGNQFFGGSESPAQGIIALVAAGTA